MDDEIVLDGEAVKAKLLALAKLAPGRVATALYEEAQIEMTTAKRRTPWDTGALRASGMVQRPRFDGREISVSMQFGGPAAAYAIYVHENLEALHPHGQAKFLESTLLESVPFMADRLAKRIRLEP